LLEERMSNEVIIGYHGKPRCAWAGAGDSAFGRYHDEVWGTRTDDESTMFEALTLGVFEVGLSWSVVFGKRDAFRTAFRDFEVPKSASPNLAALARSYEITRTRAPRSVADLPKSTPQAERFARQLKSQGFRFVGPTSVYAFMQNVGVVNDHVHGCFRAVDYRGAARLG
jgi:DNA-3-methyladenine glycosylase I